MKTPEFGETIPAEKFHVSPTNVRVSEPFGQSERDEILVYQIGVGKRLVGPFKARPEHGGYGVFVGRRRFLAKKESGAKSFVVGVDVLIEDLSEDEARKQSLIENLELLRVEMNPLSRAKALNEIMLQDGGLRHTGGLLGLSPATMSEWLKVLELGKKAQKALEKGLLNYTDALLIARSGIGNTKQDELLEVLEREGQSAFKKELAFSIEGGLKRGLPKGRYVVLRATFDKNQPDDIELFRKMSEMADAKRMKVDEYCKWIIAEFIRKAENTR
jgi:DNA-binding transcriptional ArsR family regulator